MKTVSRAAAHAALRAGFHRRLEVLVEETEYGRCGRKLRRHESEAASAPNAASVILRYRRAENVFHNRAGGGVDGIRLSPHSISTQELN